MMQSNRSGAEATQSGFVRNHPGGADIADLEARVLAVGTGWDAYQFDRHIHKTSTPALQARVLEIGTGEDTFLYASFVPNASIPACQARVLAVGSAEDVCCFAALIPGADVPPLQARVLTVGAAFDLLQFAVFVRLANVETLYAHAQAQGFAGLDDDEIAEFDARLAKYRAQRQQELAACRGGLIARCWRWAVGIAGLIELALSPDKSEQKHKMRELPRMYVEIRYARKRMDIGVANLEKQLRIAYAKLV